MEEKMALQYDYTALDTKGWTEEQHVSAANFCWTMMYLDIKDITAKNADEIIFRIEFLQELGMGPWVTRTPLSEVKERVQSLIGYKTNIKEEPRFKFIRRWVKAAEQRLEDKDGQ
jgi:hypothetical protein